MKLMDRWKEFYKRTQEEKDLRFKISVSSLVIILLGGAILADANPLRLLIPGTLYPFPAYDSRDSVNIYAIERETGKLIQAEEPVMMEGTPEDRVYRLAATVANPSAGSVRNFHKLVYAMPYPAFNLSVQKVWIEKGRLVLSIDGESLRYELKERFKGEKLEDMKEPAALLDGYFRCLTLTLAEVDLGTEDPIQFISYSLSNEQALEEYQPLLKFSFDARYAAR
ncbi:MAG: hypothetical protein RH862_02545 [Leptospiraceae bacterium]|jgi:hypothetical protein